MTAVAKRGVPVWLYVGVFFIAFMAFTVSRLPASLMVGHIPKLSGQLEGTIFSAEAKAVKIGGLLAENIELKLTPLSALTGNPSGQFGAKGKHLWGQTGFTAQENGLALDGLDMRLMATVSLLGQQLETLSRFKSAGLRVEGDRCVRGKVDVSTDILVQFFRRLGLEGAPLLEGQGSCAVPGGIRLSLQGTSDIMSASVEGVLQGRDLVADVSIVPQGPVSESLQAMLKAGGFQFDGKGFSGQVSMHLMPEA